MKTLQEIKDEVAREDNYSEWEVIGELGVSDWHVEEIAKRYAKEVAKQTLINVSENAKTVSIPIGMGRHIYSVDEETITDESNIPEL